MKKQSVARRGINKEIIIAAVVSVMQLPLLFIGIDLTDTGFYMTFYRYIYTSPESVEYNFMYWLTGIVGGAWQSIFPGIISMRVLALLCNVGCALLVSRVVGSFGGVIAGAMMVIAGLYGAPSVFNYDHLTALLTVAGLVAAIKGARSEKRGGARDRKSFRGVSRGIALSGMLIGISIFARISNVAGIAYILVVMMYAGKGRRVKTSLLWLAGYGVGVVFCMALMAALGQTGIFVANLREVVEIAGSSEASHGMGNMLAAQYKAWSQILEFPLHPRGYIWHATFSHPMIVIGFIPFVGFALHLWKGDRRIAVTSLLMMAVMPLGSDLGVFNMGTLVLWLALPVAFAACDLTGLNRKLSIPLKLAAYSVMILFVFNSIGKFVRNGVYIDNTPLMAKRGMVREIRGSGTFTGVERAKIINEIIDMVRDNVPDNEEILVYGAAPMVYYLSDTRPAMGNSWPEQWTAAALGKHLEEDTPGKYVLIMRINTYRSDFGEPSDEYAQGLTEENVYHNHAKSKLVYEYLRTHGYREIASTAAARLYKQRL